MNTKIENRSLLRKLAVIIAEHPRYTMKELAEEAGISKASLHRICGTRENLQLLLANETNDAVKNILQVVKRDYSDYEVGIRELIAIHFDHKEFLTFARDTQLCEQKGYAYEYIEAMDEFFLKGKKKGFFKAEFDAATLTELFISIFSGITNAESVGRIPTALSTRIFQDAFLGGTKE